MFAAVAVCQGHADYLRLVETVERLNQNPATPPIVIQLGSGPESPENHGLRYFDLFCASLAKLQHLDILARIQAQAIHDFESNLEIVEVPERPWLEKLGLRP